MMNHAASMNSTGISQNGWMAQAIMHNAVRSIRYFVSLMRETASRERDRQLLSKLDERMLRDIGLEPYDVYYGRGRIGRS